MIMMSRPLTISGFSELDRKSTRLNSSHVENYTLSLHDALPIFGVGVAAARLAEIDAAGQLADDHDVEALDDLGLQRTRSEEHTSELQSRRELHSFPTRRSSDLWRWCGGRAARRNRRRRSARG